MTPNERIVQAAYDVIRGDLPGPDDSGYCLALVRQVIEHALWGGAWRFYRWRTINASDKPEGESVPWARDMEASLRAADMMPDDLQRDGPPGDPTRYVDARSAGLLPGDLLFRWDTAQRSDGVFVGHVALLMPGELILENVLPSYREPGEGMWRGPNRLSPLGAWPITTAIRFDPSRPPAQGTG